MYITTNNYNDLVIVTMDKKEPENNPPLQGVIRYIGTVRNDTQDVPVYVVDVSNEGAYIKVFTSAAADVECVHGSVIAATHGTTTIVVQGPQAVIGIEGNFYAYADGKNLHTPEGKLLALGLIPSSTKHNNPLVNTNIPQLSEAAEAAFKQL